MSESLVMPLATSQAGAPGAPGAQQPPPADVARAAEPMGPARRLLVTLLALGAIGAAGWYGWRAYDAAGPVQSTSDAYVKGEITVLTPRVSGYAVAITADEGAEVRQGQVLVRLDPRDYRAATERASATLVQDEALAEQARQRLALQQPQIAVAEAALRAAEAQERNAVLALSRARELLSRGSGTQVTYDNATSAATSATSAVEVARAQVSVQRQQVDVLGADVRVAEARIADARAQVGVARTALEDTEVWAPIAGTVASRRTRVGEYVTVGTRMLSIVPKTGLWIEAQFRETQVGRMRADQPAAIRLDGRPDRTICGYVEDVGPAASSEFALVPADNATGNFTKIVRRLPVRIRADAGAPDAPLLRPGLSTTVRVAVDGAEVDGCRFDPARDRQPSSLPVIPSLPGTDNDWGASVPGRPAAP